MFVHESVAKANLKGAFRMSEHRSDRIHDSFRHYMSKKEKLRLSKADAKRFVQDTQDHLGEMVISDFLKIKDGSWHFQKEICFIEPRLYELENYGLVTPFVTHFFDSRSFLKRKSGHSRMIGSSLFFHQHFLVRAMQRLEFETVGEVGKKVLPIMLWCIHENVPFKHLPESPHFVMKDCVVVCNRLREKAGLIFKTILMKEMMNEAQLEKFSKAFDKLENEKIKSVLVDNNGGVCRTVTSLSENKSLKDSVEKSVWFAK